MRASQVSVLNSILGFFSESRLPVLDLPPCHVLVVKLKAFELYDQGVRQVLDAAALDSIHLSRQHVQKGSWSLHQTCSPSTHEAYAGSGLADVRVLGACLYKKDMACTAPADTAKFNEIASTSAASADQHSLANLRLD